MIADAGMPSADPNGGPRPRGARAGEAWGVMQ